MKPGDRFALRGFPNVVVFMHHTPKGKVEVAFWPRHWIRLIVSPKSLIPIDGAS